MAPPRVIFVSNFATSVEMPCCPLCIIDDVFAAARTEVEAMFSTKQLRTHVDHAKAAKYMSPLRCSLAAGVPTPGKASKQAGRLSFSVICYCFRE